VKISQQEKNGKKISFACHAINHFVGPQRTYGNMATMKGEKEFGP